MDSVNRPGLARIENAFKAPHPLFIPYFPIGYPTIPESLDVFRTLCRLKADIIEMGIPFSDPIADGPTIQRASHQALQNKVTLRKALEMVAQLRGEGIETPIAMMGYANCFMRHGFAELARDAAAAGVDGFVVPDLPLEESSIFRDHLTQEGLAFVDFVAPTSGPDRIAAIGRVARGYIYAVSLTGTTGARSSLNQNIGQLLARVREATTTPVAVGFGISTPDHARHIGQLADAVIVGSALITRLDESKAAFDAYVAEMIATVHSIQKSAPAPV